MKVSKKTTFVEKFLNGTSIQKNAMAKRLAKSLEFSNWELDTITDGVRLIIANDMLTNNIGWAYALQQGGFSVSLSENKNNKMVSVEISMDKALIHTLPPTTSIGCNKTIALYEGDEPDYFGRNAQVEFRLFYVK